MYISVCLINFYRINSKLSFSFNTPTKYPRIFSFLTIKNYFITFCKITLCMSDCIYKIYPIYTSSTQSKIALFGFKLSNRHILVSFNSTVLKKESSRISLFCGSTKIVLPALCSATIRWL